MSPIQPITAVFPSAERCVLVLQAWSDPGGVRGIARALSLLCGLFFLVVLVGCDGRGSGSMGSHSRGDYEHVYTVRARVTQLPDGSPSGGFYARHERIPDYVSVNGSIGMDTMVMPFTILDDSVLEGIAVGDVVEITYGESFRPTVKQGVISVTKLPADTALSFEEVSP